MTNSLTNLLATRYGKAFSELNLELNETLETLLSHKSIRHYLEKPLPDGTVGIIELPPRNPQRLHQICNCGASLQSQI
jgi:hypothetical protein